MILLDANIIMYAAGAEHPNKAPSLELLERVARGHVDAGADVEVLQEILHRYRAIGRWADGKRVFDLARQIVPTWLPVDLRALDRARCLLDDDPSLSARDALHAAVYLEEQASAFCTFDRDFDRIAGLRRVEPADLS
ncbi:MAG TPA: type II toxin-antitoxin system VapC family toxin [Myxococcota bacterium]|nr:type II toxin-antitoxin system VapC family toxin [Myxococcota bacterium]